MNTLDKKYVDLVKHVLANGRLKKDRTGVGTRSIFGAELRIDMSEGLPLLTTKFVNYRAVLHELLWFLKGSTDIRYLAQNGVGIWNDWPYKMYRQTPLESLHENACVIDGDERRHMLMHEYVAAIRESESFAKKYGGVGKVYGAQWTNWTTCDGCGYDQLAALETMLENDPDSRRMIVTAWNPPEMNECALPCCHFAFQCYTRELDADERICMSDIEELRDMPDCERQKILDKTGVPKRELSLKWTQRSTDLGLGLPFDIASYGMLLLLLCSRHNMKPGELIYSGGDNHVYLNHTEQMIEQISRAPFDTLPRFYILNKREKMSDYCFEDFSIVGYECHPAIKMPIAV